MDSRGDHRGGTAGEQRTRLLLIGPMPPPVGGCSVLFQDLVRRLREMPGLSISVVNTTMAGASLSDRIARICGGLLQLCVHGPRADVIGIHSTTTKLLLCSQFAVAVRLLFRKPVVLRKFGGLDHRYSPTDTGGADDAYVRKIAGLLLRIDLYLCETKACIEAARQDGISNVGWYPNSRGLVPRPVTEHARDRQCRRFVYVGHVCPEKGIRELTDAGEQLGAELGTSVDVYGPITGGLPADPFDRCTHVRYRGQLEPDSVIQTIAAYDALVLPTYHYGEGYPGVVLEAYAAGLPVISTTWQALPEIVDDTCGILVTPRCVSSLLQGMRRLALDDELLHDLSEGALAKARVFDADVWAAKYVDYCLAVAGRWARHG